uniref:Uncharacterized protein n=1 Tax=Arundo donax TaxID=35708 RepID=A0A0A9G4W2_ARUDO
MSTVEKQPVLLFQLKERRYLLVLYLLIISSCFFALPFLFSLFYDAFFLLI